MERREFLAGAGALAATPALAQTPAPTPPPENPSARVRVEMTTPQGKFTIELQNDRAPISCRNFLRYVDQKLYDGGKFYRASRIPSDPTYGMVQAGAKSDLAPIAHEPTTKTGLKHGNGSVSLSRYAPGSAKSDFFICIGDMDGLDADPTKPGDNQGFAVFGMVVDGMDTLKKILAMRTSPTAGVGVMKGEMLAPSLPITSARRVAKPPAEPVATAPA